MCKIDTSKLYEACKKIKIPMNTHRKNVSGIDLKWLKKNGYDKTGTKIVNNKKKKCIPKALPCESITFGLQRIFLQKKCRFARFNKKFPKVYQELKNLARKNFPQFKFNCISLNHNLQTLPHKDSVNNVKQSPVVIIGFGDYQNGELIIEGASFDIKNNPILFNGQKLLHQTAEYKGDRYSAVYYYKYYPTHYDGFTDDI